MQVSETVISKSHITSVLNRLYHYYDGRGRSCLRIAEEKTDPTEKHTLLAGAETWKHKAYVITKVAKNLDITLRKDTEHGGQEQ